MRETRFSLYRGEEDHSKVLACVCDLGFNTGWGWRHAGKWGAHLLGVSREDYHVDLGTSQFAVVSGTRDIDTAMDCLGNAVCSHSRIWMIDRSPDVVLHMPKESCKAPTKLKPQYSVYQWGISTLWHFHEGLEGGREIFGNNFFREYRNGEEIFDRMVTEAPGNVAFVDFGLMRDPTMDLAATMRWAAEVSRPDDVIGLKTADPPRFDYFFVRVHEGGRLIGMKPSRLITEPAAIERLGYTLIEK